jgi:Zn-finger nucleic acid-binding protein
LRLVACRSCHTQYDVTEVVLERFECRCGESVENRVGEPVDARIHRCGSCGALVRPEVPACDFCGSAIERDPAALSLICPECYARCAENARFCTACGVGFRPEPVKPEGHELPCPACDVPMPPHQVGGVGLNECPRCNGLWLRGDDFGLLVRRVHDARRAGDAETPARPAPRVTGANPAQQKVQYRRCPECQGFMHRRNFRRSSGVIVDVCHDHGTWLDADELERIAGFLVSGGAAAGPPEPAERTQAEQRAAAAFAAASSAATLRRLKQRPHEPGSLLGALLGTLARRLLG